jgi:CHRD domain-containing protein
VKLRLLAILVAGALAGGFAFAQDKEKKSSKGGKAVTVRIGAQNKSGESGTARLTPEGDQTKVEITLKGAPKGTPQPAHIHEGSCAKLDPKPKYGLESLVDGKSTTTVPQSIQTLTAGNLAINVHKSKEDLKTYVACGDIKAGGAKKSGEKMKK